MDWGCFRFSTASFKSTVPLISACILLCLCFPSYISVEALLNKGSQVLRTWHAPSDTFLCSKDEGTRKLPNKEPSYLHIYGELRITFFTLCSPFLKSLLMIFSSTTQILTGVNLNVYKHPLEFFKDANCWISSGVVPPLGGSKRLPKTRIKIQQNTFIPNRVKISLQNTSNEIIKIEYLLRINYAFNSFKINNMSRFFNN